MPRHHMSGGQRHAKVRIFIDFWNFAKNWQRLTKHLPEKNLDWALLPPAILHQLGEIGPLAGSSRELRAIKVYASSKPLDFIVTDDATRRQLDDEDRRDAWFKGHLDQLTGYTVDVSSQVSRLVACNICGKDTGHYAEQGVDTKIAIDLVALASREAYDIAVLVTDDTDLIPSIKCVQDDLHKRVVHLGFDKRDEKDPNRRKKNEVRNEAWGHLFIDDILTSIGV